MLNVIIELNVEDKTFDVKWVMNKESILEVGKDYCPCCYYRLNSKKNKVIELMDVLFKEEAPTVPKSEKVVTNMLAEFYSLLQVGSLDFNIVVSKEIIHERIPLKGITLKEKHVIVEELSDEELDSKNKEILDEIKKAFSGKPKDSNAEYQTVGSDEVKDVSMDEFKPENFKKMFEIMTTKVKLTREDLYNEDGSRRPVDEVYEIVQSKKSIRLKRLLSSVNKNLDYNTDFDICDNIIDVKKLLEEMFGQSLSEKSRKGNTDVDELLEEVFGKSIKLDKTEMLKKIMDHCRKVVGDTEEIGNKFTHEFASKGIISEVSKDISKPIKDVEDGGAARINQIGTTLERVKKLATYDLSVNNEPLFSLKIGKDIFLFNNIEVYYKTEDGKFHKFYLNIDKNGMIQSNVSIKEFEMYLLNNSFYNIVDFDQQRYLTNTSSSMPGVITIMADVMLLAPIGITSDFPKVEKLGNVKSILNFERFVSPSHYRTLIDKKDMKNRTSSLEKEFLYLSVYQNKLRASLGSTLNQQSKKMLYKISDNNNTLSIKKLSTWISAMHQGEDKKYNYKDILITASALKKLRQEETFGKMNFEEVDK